MRVLWGRGGGRFHAVRMSFYSVNDAVFAHRERGVVVAGASGDERSSPVNFIVLL